MVNPVVLISPAMAIGSNFYRPLIEAFAVHDWQARALPRRGFERGGERASRSNDWSYAEEIAVVSEAVAKARAEDAGRPVVLLGHSLGSHLAAGNQLHGEPVDGIVTVGGGLPWFRRYGVTWPGVVLIGGAVWPLTAVFGFVPPPAFGAPGPKTLMRQWSTMILRNRMPFEVPHRITTPTLSIHLQGDIYASSGAVRLYNDTFIDPAALTRWMYARTDAPTGGTTDHIRWVRTPQPVADRVVSWWDGS